jgi:hypothetical protein
MKYLSDEFAQQIKLSMIQKMHEELMPEIAKAEQNAKDRPEDAEFFNGVKAGLNHVFIISSKIVREEQM